MKDFYLKLDGKARVDWRNFVAGKDCVSQKLVVNTMTDIGSDKIVPTRGTRLLVRTTQGRVYDLQSAQHELNFAALSAKSSVRAAEDTEWDAADRVADFRIELVGISEGKLITNIVTTTAGGETVGKPLAI